MPSYLPQQIEKILNVRADIVNNDNIEYLLTDSRRVIHAAQSIFFAITGKNHDGHLYINELINIGVKNFVVNSLPQNIITNSANFYFVEDVIEALQKLACFHRNKFDYPVIGITGSNGKTIVKEWLFQVLSAYRNIIRNPRSYNSQIGVPVSLWNMTPDYDLGIFEAGISQTGEMENLGKLIHPSVGIFTNIGDAHQENFNSLEEKVREKIKLFKTADTIIYCSDYKVIDDILKENLNSSQTRLFSWSLKNNATFQVENIFKSDDGTEINGIYQGKRKYFRIPFTDDGSIENAINVYCLLLFLDIDNENAVNRMSVLSPVAMRLEQKKGIHGCTVINDSYNSDINSISIALDYLNQQHQHKKKTVILSDIHQSGKNESELYRQVSVIIKAKNIDHFIGIGQDIYKNQNFFEGNAKFFINTNEFIESVDPATFVNQSVLLKGARSFRFELINDLLEEKVHRTVLQINLDAVIHNLNYFRSLLKPQTKVMAMVKAISYGSGTFEIAHLLKFHHIDYLGVAYIDEGVQLRKAGVNSPIMVMNPELEHIDQLVEYTLEPELYSRDLLVGFKKVLERRGEKNYPCHLKLDTGMHRLGFMEEDIPFLLDELRNDSLVRVRSIFSHLAASDDKNFDDFTHNQFALFEDMSSSIINQLDYKVIRHILNSSGIARFPDFQYDMVRLGIGLYGFAANSEEKIRNVFTLKTLISQVKVLPKGHTVGYNPKHILQKETKIAVIAVGYADGYNRKLGNGNGKVLINNKLFPIIGNVCMDMCMVDISGSKEIKEGDEVIVFGDDYTANMLAKQLETIPYEIITNISERINRIYYKE